VPLAVRTYVPVRCAAPSTEARTHMSAPPTHTHAHTMRDVFDEEMPPPPSPLAAMAARARDPEAGQGIALLWLPTPATDPSARVEWSYAQLWATATAAAHHIRRHALHLGNDNPAAAATAAAADAGPAAPPALSTLLSPEHRSYTVGVMVEEGPGMALAAGAQTRQHEPALSLTPPSVSHR